MEGRDKGLQLHQGQPLVVQALQRLRPQVGTLAISANRHLDDYRAFGVPVWADTLAGFPGPLAGWLSALQHSATEWVITVPCDTPAFPPDLVARLVQAAEESQAGLAIASTALRPQPVFALLHRRLTPALQMALAAGERRVSRWAQDQGAAVARFDDETAFRNLNTLDDLAP